MVRKHHPGGEDASRGQMLLIGALIITFSLIVLVLLLNNVLFVQNIESEGVSAQAVETAETRQLVRQSTGEVLIRMNAGEFGGDTPDYVESNVSTMLELVSNNSKAEHGTAITLARIDAVDGTLVRQTDGGNFSNRTEGAQDWHLAEAEDVRRFQLRVNRSSLNDPDTVLGDLLGTSDGAFHVNVTDGTDTWTAFVYEDDDDIVVATAENGGSVVEQYREETPNATVALTTGRVEGEHAFEFAPNVDPPYDFYFGNGGAAMGNYTVTFNDTTATPMPASINGTNVDVGGSTSPYSTPGVYAVNLSIEQTSVRATYTGSLFVAPCRPGNDTCPRDISLGGDGSTPTGTNPGSDDPSIDELTVTSSGATNKLDITIDWEVSDDTEFPDDAILVEIVNDKGVYADYTYDPKEMPSEDTLQDVNTNSANDWRIRFTLTDNDGNSVTDTQDIPGSS